MIQRLCQNTKRANSDIREAIKKRNFHNYDVADALGVNESTFSRWLRKELSDKQKDVIFSVIEGL